MVMIIDVGDSGGTMVIGSNEADGGGWVMVEAMVEKYFHLFKMFNSPSVRAGRGEDHGRYQNSP